MCEEYEVVCSVPQGSILSPLRYSFFIDDLVQALQAAVPGLPLGNLLIHGILYADDITMVARNPAELQRLLAAAEAHSIANAYRQRAEMLTPRVSEGTPVTLYGNQVPAGKSFKYLGMEVGPKEILGKQNFESRVRAGMKALGTVSGLLSRKDLGLPVKLLAYKIFARPTMECGLALLKPLNRHLKSLQRIQCTASRLLSSRWPPEPASSAPTTGHSLASRTSPSWSQPRRAPSYTGVWRSPSS